MDILKRFRRLFAVLPVASVCVASPEAVVELNPPSVTFQQRVISVFESRRSAVVTVFAAHGSREADGKASHFVGTGFFISREGHLLTTTNVVHGANRIWIERNGIGYLAELQGSDPVTNIAVLKALATPADLEFLRFDEENELIPVGSIVIAITSELGMRPGPAMGLVNSHNIAYGERALPTVYLKTDIPLDGGEGGSPVFDLDGRVVGMMIHSLPEVRSSFVLPTRAIQRIRDDIVFGGEVQFAHVGLTTSERSQPDTGHQIIVDLVEANGPADAAGIQPGDILKKVGTVEINSDADLRQVLFYARPQQRIPFVINRRSEALERSVILGTRATPPTPVDVIREPSRPKISEPPLLPRPPAMRPELAEPTAVDEDSTITPEK